MVEARPQPPKAHPAIADPWPLRALLIGVTLAFLLIFLLLPLVTVFSEALANGLNAYFAVFRDPVAQAAIRLTLLVAAIAVPANLLFGICAAWAISRFAFPGKSLLITLIDLPFAVSPVVSGLVYVLLFGANGWLGPFLTARHLKIIFADEGV